MTREPAASEAEANDVLVEAWRESSRHPLDSSSTWHNDLHRAKRFLAALPLASLPSESIDAETLTDALHPPGAGPTVDCCMGSTVRNVHGEKGEGLHRKYHHDDAVALVAQYEKLTHHYGPHADWCDYNRSDRDGPLACNCRTQK